MGALWSEEDSECSEDSEATLLAVLWGAGATAEGLWCERCEGLEAEVYCVDCEAYFCGACAGRWHHPGTYNELHSLEPLLKDEKKGLKILTPLLDELLIGLIFYSSMSQLVNYVNEDYLWRSDICPSIHLMQRGLAWLDTVLFYYFKNTLMTSCSYEDSFWKLLLDAYVRTVLTGSDSLLLLLCTLWRALLIHQIFCTFLVPPFALLYALLLTISRSIEAHLPRWPCLVFAAQLAQKVSGISARFVSYNLQAPARTRPRLRPSQDAFEAWVYWTRRQWRWFDFYYKAAKECTVLLLANVMRLVVLFRCLGICLGLGHVLRRLMEAAGLEQELRRQEGWFQRVYEMMDTNQLLWDGMAYSLLLGSSFMERVDLRGILVLLLGLAVLAALDVLLRFGVLRRQWLYRQRVQQAVLLPMLVVLLVVPVARLTFSMVYFGLAFLLYQGEKLMSYVTEKQRERFWEQWEQRYRAETLGDCPGASGGQCPCPCTHARARKRSRPLSCSAWLRRLRRLLRRP